MARDRHRGRPARLAFNFFHLEPTGRFTIAEAENWVALAVFLVAAVIASSVAELARSRAREAEARRPRPTSPPSSRSVLLGGDALARRAGGRVAAARGGAGGLRPPPCASATSRRASATSGSPLDLGRGRSATLDLPAALEAADVERIRERIAPSLEALLGAALDREALQAEVVETQALRRSDVVKTALLRAVSHDLRTPLTAIRAAGRGAALDPPGPGRTATSWPP